MDQGREPPYLLALFANTLGGLVVLNGSCCFSGANGRKKEEGHQVSSQQNDGSLEVLDPSVRVMEISEVPIYPFLQSGGLIAMEVLLFCPRFFSLPLSTYILD